MFSIWRGANGGASSITTRPLGISIYSVLAGSSGRQSRAGDALITSAMPILYVTGGGGASSWRGGGPISASAALAIGAPAISAAMLSIGASTPAGQRRLFCAVFPVGCTTFPPQISRISNTPYLQRGNIVG